MHLSFMVKGSAADRVRVKASSKHVVEDEEVYPRYPQALLSRLTDISHFQAKFDSHSKSNMRFFLLRKWNQQQTKYVAERTMQGEEFGEMRAENLKPINKQWSTQMVFGKGKVDISKWKQTVQQQK